MEDQILGSFAINAVSDTWNGVAISAIDTDQNNPYFIEVYKGNLYLSSWQNESDVDNGIQATFTDGSTPYTVDFKPQLVVMQGKRKDHPIHRPK